VVIELTFALLVRLPILRKEVQAIYLAAWTRSILEARNADAEAVAEEASSEASPTRWTAI
jgi:hypothetical protein